MKKPIAQYIFTFNGRANRMGYFLCTLLLLALQLSACMLLNFVVIFLLSGLSLDTDSAIIAVTCLSFIAMALFSVFGYMLIIQRLHDLNLSGWWALLMLVPVVDFFLALFLFFAVGTKGANRFGNDLLEN